MARFSGDFIFGHSYAMGPDNASRFVDRIEEASGHAAWCSKLTPCHEGGKLPHDPVMDEYLQAWKKFAPIGKQLHFGF